MDRVRVMKDLGAKAFGNKNFKGAYEQQRVQLNEALTPLVVVDTRILFTCRCTGVVHTSFATVHAT